MATACATILGQKGIQVSIWSRDEQHARTMQEQRENERQLPGIKIPDSVEVTSDVESALKGAEIIVAAVPTQFLRGVLETLSPALTETRPVVSVIKGLENETLMRPSQIISEVLDQRSVVALGGPSHAEEFARGLPASVVAAGGDARLTREVQELFNTDRFRVYTNIDIVGVELAGALKNVIAIAAGICDGLGYGDNAKSALVARGLVEITRFGTQMGAEANTFYGLAGIGDLITTCISPYGRNRGVGERLGKGETLAQIVSDMKGVAEGVATTRSVYELSLQQGIEMPLTEQIFQVLFEEKSPGEATDALMMRPPKDE
ncbi:Glycerol-3-phosphate dehydrogenase [NAD(P)+] [Polystyrenella longa]|uniref:Glycerol-3-phosphate dehydrogenase [NAD(P)+] n=2 Tax=Polystyrenella longa TaxID=2528007 RepID=A0A518CRP5_9PLAN|nr:Glycerol-3-phosphate dehydrogenase [NAD(P)+] [Polystyrenella longa]